MDELGRHYHKQNNPDKEQISHGNSYMWNLKRKKKSNLDLENRKMFPEEWENREGKLCKIGYKFSVQMTKV